MNSILINFFLIRKIFQAFKSLDLKYSKDNQEELYLDSLDKILAQCIEKQIENLQAKERSVGLSAEQRRELQDLMKDLKA